MNELKLINTENCKCGKPHRLSVDSIIIGSGVIKKLPDTVKKYGAKKAFVISDKNTYKAAGEKVCALLDECDIAYTSYSFDQDSLEPNETNVGLAVMYFDKECDIVIGVGSGVINDIGKILSSLSSKPYIIVATAPSMDGYASATSSMTREALKISIPSKSADVIIGDTDILRNAPTDMMRAGLGDMIAKYVSICEWRISHLITGEYYCESIAELIRNALAQCAELAPKLMERDEKAVAAVFKGLVLSGLAMNFAGLSRPASGVEHYFSHLWDMRGAVFGTPVSLHGVQCAIGTLLAIKIYENLKKTTPNREKAIEYVEKFDLKSWNAKLREFLGKGAESMIELEKTEKKYCPLSHRTRLEIIIKNWDNILKIIDEELPPYDKVKALIESIGSPVSVNEIGLDDSILPMSFKATKDIRNKYVLSRLAWDLGIIEEIEV